MKLFKVNFWNWRAENETDFIIFDNKENAQRFIEELKDSIKMETIKK